MTIQQTKRVAIIGAGISGLAAAHTLQKRGYRVTIYEKTDKVGGVWAISYPNVRLQNSYHQYHISDFPWPIKPDLHPTGQQILTYFDAAIKALNLDVRLNHTVRAMHEVDNGWAIDIEHAGQTVTENFDFAIIAVGQYTGRKHTFTRPGQDTFQGDILTENDVQDMSIFQNKRVVVIGFGKSALDMTTFAVQHGAEVHHVFRTPRWTLPSKVFGIHYTRPFFARISTAMMTSWAQPNNAERFLHEKLPFVIGGFWQMISGIFRLQRNAAAFGKGADARRRLAKVKPAHGLLPDLRSAIALAPDDYYPYVAAGNIEPYHAEVTGFSENSVTLSTGETIEADIVVTAIGSSQITFPFLPHAYRDLLEGEPDSVQLYRHLIHPRIPNLGFAGFNHGFLHIPAAEVGALWLSAVFNGEMELPSAEEMEATIEHVRQWKRDNIHFEPSRSAAINTRYQQYLDILLQDIGLSPNRKSNPIVEVFDRYSAADYADVVEDYEANLAKHQSTQSLLRPIEVHT